MILVAYLSLIAAVVWITYQAGRPRSQRWLLNQPTSTQRGLLGMSLAGASLIFLIALSVPGLVSVSSAGVGLLALLALGALAYAAGVILWQGSLAFALRLGGWLLMAFPLVVPTTLTLTLPIVALLSVTLLPIDVGEQKAPAAYVAEP